MKKFLFLITLSLFISCSQKQTFTGRFYGFLNLKDTYGYGEIEFKEDHMEVYVYEDFFTAELLLKSCPRKEKLQKDGSVKTKIFDENWTFSRNDNNLFFENESGRYFILSPEKRNRYEMNNFEEKIKSFVEVPNDPEKYIDEFKNKIQFWNKTNEIVHDYSKEPFKGSNFYYKTVYYDNGVEITFSIYGEISVITFTNKIPDESLTKIIGIDVHDFFIKNYIYDGFSIRPYYEYNLGVYNCIFNVNNGYFNSIEIVSPI